MQSAPWRNFSRGGLGLLISCVPVLLSSSGTFLSQILAIAILTMGLIVAVKSSQRRPRTVRIFLIAWVITRILPFDVAIRGGPRAMICFAKVVHGVSPERLMQEQPGQVFIQTYSSPIRIWRAVVVVVPTDRVIETPLWQFPRAPFLIGPIDIDIDRSLPIH